MPIIRLTILIIYYLSQKKILKSIFLSNIYRGRINLSNNIKKGRFKQSSLVFTL